MRLRHLVETTSDPASREHFMTTLGTNSREVCNLEHVAVPIETATPRATPVFATTQGSAKGAATTTNKTDPHAHLLSRTHSLTHTRKRKRQVAL